MRTAFTSENAQSLEPSRCLGTQSTDQLCAEFCNFVPLRQTQGQNFDTPPWWRFSESIAFLPVQ